MSGIFLLLVVLVLSQARANTISQDTEIKPLSGFANLTSNSTIHRERLPANCFEATYTTQSSGIYVIQPFTLQPFPAYCDADIHGGGWTVIQRRKDGSVDFFRDWQSYKEGFGNIIGEFWIGLDNLRALTLSSQQELLVVMEDFYSNSAYAMYDSFAIGSETEGFHLKALGKCSGDAGDALLYHKNFKFATKDKDHEICAAIFKGAWWYNNCFHSNLNGQYDSQGRGTALWNAFNHTYSLKYAAMMVRPKLA